MIATCDSCGRDGEEVGEVRRVYVRADTWDSVDEAVAEDRVRVLDEVERWCVACRLQYPHQPLES